VELSEIQGASVLSLQHAGRSFEQAMIIVVMATRTTATGRRQLIDEVLTGYPGLEDPSVVSTAISQLTADGWLVEDNVSGAKQCRAAKDILTRIGELIGPGPVSALAELRGRQTPNLTLIGRIDDQVCVDTVYEAVRSAQREICLPFLSTPSSIVLAEELHQRARRGVRIRILVASAEVVAKLRGEAQRQRGVTSVRGWIDSTRDWPNTEVRIATHSEDMLMAASASFDANRTILAVFDTGRQRAHESTVIDVERQGYALNLVTLFNRHFNDAWARARPTTGARRTWWRLSRFAWEITFVVFLIVAAAFSKSQPTLSSVAAGVSATALITCGLRYREGVRRIYLRLRQ
jgi:phosphatidylserine/phosphatidylglycerophosphate/cardiolipin synthase-like enzyme